FLSAVVILGLVGAFVSLTGGSFPFNAVIVVVRDDDVFLPPNLEKPVRLPSWRVCANPAKTFEWRRIFRSITLIEASLDDGATWYPACAPGYLSYQVSRLIERKPDWQTSFSEFVELVTKDVKATRDISTSSC